MSAVEVQPLPHATMSAVGLHPSAASRGSAVNLSNVKQLLEKKASFLTALVHLSTALQTRACSVDAAFPLVSRVYTLLKSRYSNVAFWKKGMHLFTDLMELPLSAVQLLQLQTYLAEATDFLRSEDAQQDVDSAAAAASVSLVDMLRQPMAGGETHMDDAGLIVDDVLRWQRAQVSGRVEVEATGSSTASEHAGQDEAARVARPVLTAAQLRTQQHQEMQQAILEGIQAVHSGMDAVTHGTEAVEQELETILAMLHNDAPYRPARPPASKRAVAALPKQVLTQESLSALGAGTVCAVCTCELEVGEEVQSLPCKHSYHPACLAPWLAQQNSCPECRHELATDDHQYESRKEREVQEAEEAKGARNAVSDNFMYI